VSLLDGVHNLLLELPEDRLALGLVEEAEDVDEGCRKRPRTAGSLQKLLPGVGLGCRESGLDDLARDDRDLARERRLWTPASGKLNITASTFLRNSTAAGSLSRFAGALVSAFSAGG
jgi:hypothetical protein